ncbi:MAG: hypothetical protein M1839_000983 [Geoglossum umbratile]|nr:MAG: hypothetical protein M1839_000983 [Geoglossum umbratile]
MSTRFFRVQEHTVPCQYIREYPGATEIAQEDVLELAVKQYTPLDNQSPAPGDITIIGSHGNGFPKVLGLMLRNSKELYEPLWDEMLIRSRKHGFRIRSIWIADVSHQGQSGVLNEDRMGDDVSLLDHPRDLLHMINLFRAQMPRPLVGVGHRQSIVTNIAFRAMLSLIHPRLLTTLVLMEPIIQEFKPGPPDSTPTEQSTFRRDLWPSRREAEATFRKSRFYQKWDERVLQRWVQYGLRDLPTAVYDSSTEGSADAVTLTTTKHQELRSFLRPNFDGKLPDGSVVVNRLTHADLDPYGPLTYPFYRPEPPWTLKNLPHIRPSVLYIFGGKSPMSAPELRNQKMGATGIGVGGSGGAKEGRVKSVVLEGIGHEVAMQAAGGCADAAASWLGAEISRWKAQEEEFRAQWSKRSRRDKLVVSESWKQKLAQQSKL